MAKPTALLPGLALMAYVARRDPLGATRGLVGGLIAAVVVAELTYGPDKLFKVHVIDWNDDPLRPSSQSSIGFAETIGAPRGCAAAMIASAPCEPADGLKSVCMFAVNTP